MAETCVLGHAWTPGRVLCAVCGFGPRAVQPGQSAPAAQAAALTTEPELAVAGASARLSRGLQLDDAAAAPSLPTEPAPPELVLSPDGQWAWDGTQWVPAPVQPESAPQADLLPEPTPIAPGVAAAAAVLVTVAISVVAAVGVGARTPPRSHRPRQSARPSRLLSRPTLPGMRRHLAGRRTRSC